MFATLLNISEHWPGADEALNEAARALDLDGDGTVSMQELVTSIASDQRGAARLLMSASKQVNMGQNVAQVRPVVGGGVVDGLLKGKVGDPITCVGHGLMAQYEACDYAAGREWLQRVRSEVHVVLHDTNGKGDKCVARQSIGEGEVNQLFAEIEARCEAAFLANKNKS